MLYLDPHSVSLFNLWDDAVVSEQPTAAGSMGKGLGVTQSAWRGKLAATGPSDTVARSPDEFSLPFFAETRQDGHMNRKKIQLLAALITGLAGYATAVPQNPNTDWFRDAKYGVLMHFLPDAKTFGLVEAFDAQSLANQLERAGAKYLVLTLGQNSGYFNSPNATYDRYSGYAAGERCAKRDLPQALHRLSRSKGIKLMLYLPCQVPNQDIRAQKAFGLAQGQQDQPLSLEFARKWAEVIQEWSDRYGDKVAGWWFDGGYQHIHFSEAIAETYSQAAKHGNPKAIVTFNPGVRVIHYTQAEDYTAGELNEPFDQLPASRWLDGSQWHALTFLGSNWGQRNTRYPAQQWAGWVKAVTDKGRSRHPRYGPELRPAGRADRVAFGGTVEASGGDTVGLGAGRRSREPMGPELSLNRSQVDGPGAPEIRPRKGHQLSGPSVSRQTDPRFCLAWNPGGGCG